jgi:PAS domain S-box-containing protein
MKSLSFRIWASFALFISVIIMIIAFYYSKRQEELYIENSRFDLQEASKSVALAVELSLDHENLVGLKKALELAKSTDDFEKVSVVVFDSAGRKKELFANPDTSKLDVLNLDLEKYILEKYPFKSELLKGEIYMVSSKAKIDEVLKSLNYPLYTILIGLFVFSLVIFYLFARWLVKPVVGLIKFSESIKSNQLIDFNNELNTTKEIHELGDALISLSNSLQTERNRTAEILNSLEYQVSERTKENNLLSLVAKHALNGVIITDKYKKIIWANQSLLKITGYELDEIIGKSPKIFQFEGSNPDTLQRINDALSRNEIVNEQILNRSKDGREYWLELHIVPLFDADEVSGYIAIETDITARILDDELLRKSEALNRRILENASEMIHALDVKGNLLWANHSWLDNLNFTAEEVEGRSILEFLDQETLLEFKEVFPRLMKGESVADLNCVFLSKSKEQLYLSGKTIPLFDGEKIIGSQAYLHNVTQNVKAQKLIQQKSLLQDLVMRISTKYINLPIDQLVETINDSLRELSNFIQADRAYIYNYFIEEGYCKYEYEWAAPGIRSLLNEKKLIELNTMPVWYDSHKRKEFIIIENAELVTDEKVKDLLAKEGIKSLISIPIHDENRLVGFVGFDLIKNHRIFSDDEKEILVLFSQMIVNVYNRIEYIRDLNNSKLEIEEINATLELRVAENTKKNLDLSMSIVEQEKMATIGEISAGIAHDLNTPLSTIKVGSDNVRSIVETIFTKKILLLTENQLSRILKRIQTNQVEMFVGGLQLRREKVEMIEFLSKNHDLDSAEQEKMADLLVKARVSKEDTFEIKYLIETENRIENLEVLYQLQMVFSQLASIKNSSDKAVKVVQDVRAFIKGENQQEKRVFNLKDNLSTVLGIFNYELKKEVDLQFKIDESIELYGFEIKLFQLWSNLVKNALEAMEDQEQRYLGIFAEKTTETLSVIFENNGPKIPAAVLENMFNKFYTTKGKKSGSGLGLSIVKNITEEHNADISVTSDVDKTKFIITFQI